QPGGTGADDHDPQVFGGSGGGGCNRGRRGSAHRTITLLVVETTLGGSGGTESDQAGPLEVARRDLDDPFVVRTDAGQLGNQVLALGLERLVTGRPHHPHVVGRAGPVEEHAGEGGGVGPPVGRGVVHPVDPVG